MRLKSLTIGQYKNLKDFTLNFDGSSFLDVFVGKNGSGKSNLFEALIEIFRHLYEYDKVKGDPGFSYTIQYEIDDKDLLGPWFQKRATSGGGEIIEFVGDKVSFAKNFVPTLDAVCFDVFRPMFDFIRSKCSVTGTAIQATSTA